MSRDDLKAALIEAAHHNLDITGFEALRAGGRVLRYHQIGGALSQRVDQHSWGVATLILHLWPDASRDLLIAALYHDVGEHRSGDIPAQVKWQLSGASMTELDFVEEQGHIAVTGEGWPNLSSVDMWRLKIADQLELMRWCLEKMREGDRAFAWAPFWRVAGLLLKDGRSGIENGALPIFDAWTNEALNYTPSQAVLDRGPLPTDVVL